MTSSEFFAYLRSLDVQLWMDGDRLRCSAPRGVLTAELNEELKRRKEEIVASLRAAQQATQSRFVPIAPVARDQDLTLSFAQQRLWFLEQLSPGSPAYNLAGTLRLTGTLDVDALERAMAEMIKRHEI